MLHTAPGTCNALKENMTNNEIEATYEGRTSAGPHGEDLRVPGSPFADTAAFAEAFENARQAGLEWAALLQEVES